MLGLFHDTIVAIATPESRSALAIVRISGPDAIGMLGKIVGDSASVFAARGGGAIYTSVVGSTPPPPRIVGDASPLLIRFTPEEGVRGSEEVVRGTVGRTIDDVVIHVYRARRSYTGEDLCEITCHGSPVIAREIVALLVANGARHAEPGEFSRRAFFNGKIGLEEAELISVKANAESERELRGAELALAEKYVHLRSAHDKLISLIAQVDAEIDFGDSDQIEIYDFDSRIAEVTSEIELLVRNSANRRENTGYFTVALVGPPNVGKSSVFNALLNFERSIVSDIPGTTRDYVEAFINVGGFRVKLVDTAGLREADESLEARGISLGSEAARHADISLRVTEPGGRSPILSDGEILLHNKIDLDSWNEGLSLSALTGDGIELFHAWLLHEFE